LHSKICYPYLFARKLIHQATALCKLFAILAAFACFYFTIFRRLSLLLLRFSFVQQAIDILGGEEQCPMMIQEYSKLESSIYLWIPCEHHGSCFQKAIL